MPYFSQFVGLSVVDGQGISQGKLADMVVSNNAAYPEVRALVVSPRRRGEAIYVSWEDVQNLNSTCVLRDTLDKVVAYVPGDNDVHLGRQVLDRQIIDVEGRKVVRVNDLQMARTNGHVRLIGVDVSPQALLRRIGVSPFTSRLGIRPDDHVIPWADVDPVSSDLSHIRLRVTQQHLSKLRPADLADIVEDLSLKESAALLATMDTEMAADALEEVGPERQVSLIESLDRDRAADILEEMDPDDAADLLGELSHEKADELLSLMEEEEQAEVRELLGYPEDSAGGIMTTEYVAVAQTLTAQQIVNYLRTDCRDMEVIDYVYILAAEDDKSLVGVTSLRDLIMADQQISQSLYEWRSRGVARDGYTGTCCPHNCPI